MSTGEVELHVSTLRYPEALEFEVPTQMFGLLTQRSIKDNYVRINGHLDTLGTKTKRFFKQFIGEARTVFTTKFSDSQI